MTKPYIKYRSGYEYQLVEDYQIKVSVIPSYNIITTFLKLNTEGMLTIKRGYAWDGPSRPTIDTPNFIRCSLVHDALYQLLRNQFLEPKCWKEADDELRRICREDGVPRAWWEWLIDERRPLDRKAIKQFGRELHTSEGDRASQLKEMPYLAVRIQDIIIHANKKWFGEADIRLDALVVHGNGTKDEPESFYMPQTFRFSRITDGDRLPIGLNGLLIYYGKPLHFLDIFITVSRDRKDSEDLSKLLSEGLQSKEIQGAVGPLLGLAIAAPQVAAITSAVGAAAAIGGFAYQVLSKLTGSTIGLYRNSYLQYRDSFGIGRHPKTETFRVKDLSFFYEVVIDKPPDSP